MLTLCICDDDAQEGAAVQALAERFALAHPEFPLQIQRFSAPFDLLERIERKGGFDLYLLDIVMPNIEGVELASRIRARGETAEILFLTSSREYALEAFGVSACGYLLKPLDSAQFDATLLAAVKRLAQPEKPSFLLKTRDGLRKIRLGELVAVESFNHDRVCYLADGTSIVTTDTLVSLMERLSEDRRFFSPHRAYIINLDHITALTPTAVTMSNGRKIPVARNIFRALKSAYVDYLF